MTAWVLKNEIQCTQIHNMSNMQLRVQAYGFLVAWAISARSDPWGPHGSLLVASRT